MSSVEKMETVELTDLREKTASLETNEDVSWMDGTMDGCVPVAA